MSLSQRLTSGLCCAAMALATGAALAQGAAWPNRPITLVVPFSAGGSNDVIARAIANEMSQSLKQPVVVENRGGAGGMLGAGQVARAAPDGHTLLLASNSLTIGVALKKGLPFDGRKDLTPIALAANGTLVLLASNKVAAKTPAELVALAKANPGKLTYASAGVGGLPHLATEMLAAAGGLQLVHVPYKGGTPAMSDMIGGQVDLYFGSFSVGLPLVRAGKIQAIGVASRERFPLVPDIPPMSAAVPGFSVDVWWGVFGPGNMPPELVTRLNAEVNKALQSQPVRKFAETEGVMPGKADAQQFARIYTQEIESWEALGRKTNIKLE